jgi:hypothetical protein
MIIHLRLKLHSIAAAMDSDTLALHREFRCLIALLTLVTALQNCGTPIFRLALGFIEGFRPIFDNTLPTREVVAGAICAVSVQNHEVSACMTHELPADPTSGESSANQPGKSPVSGFTVVVNPDDNIPEQKDQKDNYIVAPKGQSQFAQLSVDHWSCLNTL